MLHKNVQGSLCDHPMLAPVMTSWIAVAQYHSLEIGIVQPTERI